MFGANHGSISGGIFGDKISYGIDKNNKMYIYNHNGNRMVHYGDVKEGFNKIQNDFRPGRGNISELVWEGNKYLDSQNHGEGEENNAPNPSPASTGGGGSSYDPYAAERARQRADEIAAYREAENDARNALGRIGRQREIGLSNINQNYAEQLNQIENDYTQSKGAYDLNTQETIANNRAARERIAEEAGQKADSLRKMFAAGGAGDSSAAQIVAPYAVSLDASKQSSQQQDEYARNRRALDMEFANFSNAYNQNKRKLESEKQNQINALEQNIENTKMSLNNQIREAQQKAHTASGGSLSQAINNTAGLKNEIRASEDRILDLSKKTPVALDKIAFNAPKLESYADNQEGGKIETGNPDQAGLKNQLDPRLANLLDPNKKKKDLEEE